MGPQNGGRCRQVVAFRRFDGTLDKNRQADLAKSVEPFLEPISLESSLMLELSTSVEPPASSKRSTTMLGRRKSKSHGTEAFRSLILVCPLKLTLRFSNGSSSLNYEIEKKTIKFDFHLT